MPKVLTEFSTVTCGHIPGKVSTSSNVKLKVDGYKVLLKSSIENKTISGCAIPVPPNENVKCLKVTSVTAGEAIKLTVGGNAVMLEEALAGQTNGKVAGTPQTLLSATADQNKLTAI